MAKLTKKQLEQQLNLKKGVLALVAAVAVAFVLGAAMIWTTSQTLSTDKVDRREFSLTGTDGYYGLVGYSDPFKIADKVVYKVSYTNESSHDQFINIKATMREKNGQEKVDGVMQFGAYTGVVYSEKKEVKKGETEVFKFPVVEYSSTPTRYIELEAFKAITDGQ